jgi:hypothetical protein
MRNLADAPLPALILPFITPVTWPRIQLQRRQDHA